jgi:hypothetical protein
MDVLRFLISCCTVPLIALVMLPMGIYSVISEIAAVREPEARGKSLTVVATLLGRFESLKRRGTVPKCN